MNTTIFTVVDLTKKIAFKQFKVNPKDNYQHSKDYDLKSRKAHSLQSKICKQFGIVNNGLRIGVHINLFNDIPKERFCTNNFIKMKGGSLT